MSDQTAPQPQIKIAWLIGTLAAFAIFAAIGGYSARMTQTYTDYDDNRAAQRYANLAQTRDAENKLLYPVDDNKKPTAEWVDQDKGLIRIPINEAMALEVDTLKAQPSAIGCEIPGSVPAPPPTPASTNAAPAAPAPPAAPAKPGAPAKPAASGDKPKTPAKPVKTTSTSPSEPVFKTREINTNVWVRDGNIWFHAGNIWVMGTPTPTGTASLAQPKT